MYLYVGTFTDGFMGGPPSEGMYVFDLADDLSSAGLKQIIRDVFSPSYLCLAPDQQRLFVAERQVSPDDATTGAISAWRISADGGLSREWKQPSGGASCAHISVSHDGRTLAVANPIGRTIGLCHLGADHGPIGPVRLAHHQGKGARPRQADPWPHSATFDPRDGRILACDLALDRLFVYQVDGDAHLLTPGPQPYAQLSSGAGARHMAWSKTGAQVYVANELDSTVSVFDYDIDSGMLVCSQTIGATQPVEPPVPNQPAEIVTSPDGRWLYVSNRGVDCISVFEILPDTGRLRWASQAPVAGKVPRNFALSPDGKCAFVVNQLSGAIMAYRVDSDTGALAMVGQICAVPNPSCVVVR